MRFRSLLDRAWFAPARSIRLRENVARRARTFLDLARAAGSVDFMRAVAMPLACYALADFFGDPEPTTWSDLASGHSALWAGHTGADHAAIDMMQKHLWSLVGHASDASATLQDATFAMVHVRDGSATLTGEEIATLLLQSAITGGLTLTLLLGEVALVMCSPRRVTADGLAHRPDSAPRRSGSTGRRARSIAMGCADRNPPVRAVFRRTPARTTLGSRQLESQWGVVVPLQWLERGVPFGAGSHSCPGAYLSVMIASALSAAIQTTGGLQLVEEPPLREWWGLSHGLPRLMCSING